MVLIYYYMVKLSNLELNSIADVINAAIAHVVYVLYQCHCRVWFVHLLDRFDYRQLLDFDCGPSLLTVISEEA